RAQAVAGGGAGMGPGWVQVPAAIVPGCSGSGAVAGAVPTHTVEPGTHWVTQAKSVPLKPHWPAAQGACVPHWPVGSQVSMSVTPPTTPVPSVQRWVPGVHTPQTMRGPPEAGAGNCMAFVLGQGASVLRPRAPEP